MSPPSVRHRVLSGLAGDDASAAGADEALLVSHHAVGPVLAWIAAPAVAWTGYTAIGHLMPASLAGFVALGATAIGFAHDLPVALHAAMISSHGGEARRESTGHLYAFHPATVGETR